METNTPAAPVRFIRRREVCERTGIKTSTLYLLLKRGDFPPPVRLVDTGKPNAPVAWVEAEVNAWIAERIAGRRCSYVASAVKGEAAA